MGTFKTFWPIRQLSSLVRPIVSCSPVIHAFSSYIVEKSNIFLESEGIFSIPVIFIAMSNDSERTPLLRHDNIPSKLCFFICEDLSTLIIMLAFKFIEACQYYDHIHVLIYCNILTPLWYIFKWSNSIWKCVLGHSLEFVIFILIQGAPPPETGGDEYPPPYPSATSEPGMNVVTCRVCQALIDISSKKEQHVVKCTHCHEATVSLIFYWCFWWNLYVG